MRTYATTGHGYLVCPRLLELDERHGRHWSKHPRCARGQPCIAEHEHEEPLPDAGGHRVVDFHWWPGHWPPDPDFDPITCACGRVIVWSDLDDPWSEAHLAGEDIERGS